MVFASTVVGLITAVSSVITAVALLVTAVASLLKIRRLQHSVNDVHTIVNQQRTDAAKYQADLIAELRANDIEVPKDQSL
jgi:cobalamin biosynthesis protein CobD/CbiB